MDLRELGLQAARLATLAEGDVTVAVDGGSGGRFMAIRGAGPIGADVYWVDPADGVIHDVTEDLVEHRIFGTAQVATAAIMGSAAKPAPLPSNVVEGPWPRIA